MCMCVSTGPQGCTMVPPLKLFLCSKFAPALRRYSQWKFLPRSLVNVCSTGLITAQQGRALLPARSAISRLRGTIPFFKTRGFLFFFFFFFRKHERRSLLRIRRLQRGFFFFCGLREVRDEWCMVWYAGSDTRIGCYRHDTVLWCPSPQRIRLSPWDIVS